MIRVILFDFDGTLADTFDLVLKAVNENAEQFGYEKISEPEVLRQKGAKEIIRDELNLSLWKVPYYMWRGKKILQDEIKKAKLFAGAKELIAVLQGEYKVGILTSNKRGSVEEVLSKEGVSVDILECDSSLLRKDKKLGKVMRKYGFSKEEMIYVGDEIRDVKACIKAGVFMIGVSWGYNTADSLEKAGVARIAQRLVDITQIVKSRGKSL